LLDSRDYNRCIAQVTITLWQKNFGVDAEMFVHKLKDSPLAGGPGFWVKRDPNPQLHRVEVEVDVYDAADARAQFEEAADSIDRDWRQKFSYLPP